jgi:hypothetical protein
MITKRTKLLTGMLCGTALMLPAVGLMALAPPGTALAGPGGGHDDFRGHAQHNCKHYDGDKELCRDAQDLDAAWREYLATIDDVTDQLQQSPNYETDPTGLYDIQSGMIITNIMSQFGSAGSGIRGNRPRWSFFDTPDVRIGVDNPDTRYLAAATPNGDGQNVYKVYGNRSDTCDQIILTLDPSNPQGGGDTLEDEEMVNLAGNPLQLNEDYEVFLSTAAERDPNWLNWLEIGASEVAAVHHRYTVCNYHTERPGNPAIERVGTEGVPITAEEFRDPVALAQGIRQATAVLANQQPFWAGFAELIQNSGLPENVISPWVTTGSLGITTQLNSNSWLTIPDGMAYVLKVRTDYPGAYGSWMLYNGWGSSLQWGSNMVNGSFEITGSAGNSYFMPSAIPEPINPSLCAIEGADPTTCEGQARYTYIVISNDDIVATHPITSEPVVPANWMTTMGHSPVYIAGRLQSVPNNGDPNDPNNPFNEVQGVGGWMAFGFLVPQAAIQPFSPALPADFQWISEDDRTAQIRTRQIYQQEKYAPW